VRIVIVGSGFGAVACARELLRAGHRDITVLERGDEMGGVWRDNTYPGAGCDIPSPLYSFSFAPNPGWSRRYAQQGEIHAYLRRVAHDEGIDALVSFGAEVVSATFDDDTGRWTVTTADGRVREAEVLVSAVGQLSRPAWPLVPGLELFDGPCFHSALWDHRLDPRGKNIAVIGTGASSVQFVPELARVAESVTIFQRTPAFIAPKADTPYGSTRRALYRRVPLLLRLERRRIWLLTELLGEGMSGTTRLARLLSRATGRLCLWHLRSQVPDDDLRARLTPDYTPGCKRVLFSNDYLPALGQPHVEVVTAAITEVTPEAILTADGVQRLADAIVVGTGFATQEFLAPMRVTGRGGSTLDEVWSSGARAYLGMCVPDFPNLFLVYGPNTNTGSGSMIDVLQAQGRYIRQCVDRLATGARGPMEVRRDVADAFDDDLQRRLGATVWARCASWYRDSSGRISSNWPGRVSQYVGRVRSLEPNDFSWRR